MCTIHCALVHACNPPSLNHLNALDVPKQAGSTKRVVNHGVCKGEEEGEGDGGDLFGSPAGRSREFVSSFLVLIKWIDMICKLQRESRCSSSNRRSLMAPLHLIIREKALTYKRAEKLMMYLHTWVDQ